MKTRDFKQNESGLAVDIYKDSYYSDSYKGKTLCPLEPQGKNLLIEDKNEAFAFITSVENNGLIQITDLAVKKAYQNLGYAKDLCKKTFAYWKEKGYKTISVDVNKAREKSIILYKSLGFVILEEDMENIKMKRILI